MLRRFSAQFYEDVQLMLKFCRFNFMLKFMFYFDVQRSNFKFSLMQNVAARKRLLDKQVDQDFTVKKRFSAKSLCSENQQKIKNTPNFNF